MLTGCGHEVKMQKKDLHLTQVYVTESTILLAGMYACSVQLVIPNGSIQ